MFRRNGLFKKLNQMRSRNPKARRKSRRFSYEPLEDRRLMAVTTMMKNGNLYITGDDTSENVVISAGPRPGLVIVNGQIFPGFYKDISDIFIDLKGGNDKVTINNLKFGDLTVKMGLGNDEVYINGVETNGRTDINMGVGYYTDTVMIAHSNFHSTRTEIYLGGGDDWLIINNLTVGAPCIIDASADNDYVAINKSKFYSIDVKLGDGWDQLYFSNSSVTVGARFDAGICPDTVAITGSDFYGTLTVYGGDHRDDLRLVNCWVAGNATLDAGAGDDYVSIENSDFLSALAVNLQSGNDTLAFWNFSTARQVNIKGGDGNDTVTILDGAFENLDVALGAHDDVLKVARINVYGRTKFDGGSGTYDRYFESLEINFNNSDYSRNKFEYLYIW